MKKRDRKKTPISVNINIPRLWIFIHICTRNKFNMLTEKIFRILVNSLVEQNRDTDERYFFAEITPDEICEKLGIDSTETVEKSLEQISKATFHATVSSEELRKDHFAYDFYVFRGTGSKEYNGSREYCLIFDPSIADALIQEEEILSKENPSDSFYRFIGGLKG